MKIDIVADSGVVDVTFSEVDPAVPPEQYTPEEWPFTLECKNDSAGFLATALKIDPNYIVTPTEDGVHPFPLEWNIKLMPSGLTTIYLQVLDAPDDVRTSEPA